LGWVVGGQTSGLGWVVRGHLCWSGCDVGGQTFTSGWDVIGQRESGWLVRGQTRVSLEVVAGAVAAATTGPPPWGAGPSVDANSGESVTSPAEAVSVRPKVLQRAVVTSTAATARAHPSIPARRRAWSEKLIDQVLLFAPRVAD
jgi:hypothetical protein